MQARLEDLRSAGAEAIARLPAEDLLRGWLRAVGKLADPGSALRRELGPRLLLKQRLSPPGLAAGLACIARGVGESVARRLLEEPAAPPGGLDAVLLAGNVPALFAQPLLRSLAARRPVLLKPASVETELAARFVEDLAREEPALAPAIAIATWRGGHRAIEDAVFAAAARVIAYGGESALRSIAARAGDKLIAHGPKTSLAVALPGAEPDRWAAGLARDVALFDQRGCLSVAALFVHEGPTQWAAALAGALRSQAIEWPPGTADLGELAAVRLAREEAALRGVELHECGNLANGSVLVEKRLGFAASPGLRTVRICAYADFEDIAQRLAPWRGRLQGLAICGEPGLQATARLASDLGISRAAAAGELQEAPASWDDGAPWAPAAQAP